MHKFFQQVLNFPVCILGPKFAPFHYVNEIFGRNIGATSEHKLKCQKAFAMPCLLSEKSEKMR